MRANDLIDILAEKKIANLGACLDSIQLYHLLGVPESDASVSCASSTS